MKNTDFVTLREAEKFSKKKINKKIFDWLQSGSEDNHTTDKNIEDLENLKIKPFHLRRVKDINLCCNFLGKKISSPLILSPMGHQTQFHHRGEIEVAKGVNKINSISFFSTQGRMSLKDIRKNNSKANLCWTIFPFGKKKDAFIFIGHFDHPNQINDGLAGVIASYETIKRIKNKKIEFTYVAFASAEIIGSVYYLNKFKDLAKNLKEGLFVTLSGIYKLVLSILNQNLKNFKTIEDIENDYKFLRKLPY